VPQKGGTIPDGDQVSLLANQGIIGSGTLLRGVASITTSELKDTNPPQKRPGGDIEPVTAMYAGDQNFAPNSSVPVSINVDRWPTTGSVEVSPNPSMFCQPIAFTPYVTSDGPNAPTGVVYLEGASPVIGAVPIGETETFSGCYFSGYVLYEGDAYNDWSDDFINHTVEPSTTTTTITSSKNPSVLGTAATFKVSVVAPWAKNVYGSVTLTLGATILGTMEIASNTVFIHTSSLPLGQNTVTATYTPLFAREFLGGSASMVQTVSSPKATTTTALVSSLNPSTYGQTVSWTATVTSTGANTPTGTVKFAGIGAGTLSGGVATITKTWLNAAAYPITAEYGGDSASTPSSSSVLNQVVNPASTTTAITSSVNPSSLGQTVTFTATVTSSTGAKPVGSVTFTAGAVTLGTIALAGTSASVSTATLPEGSITVTANYNGATDYTGSSASLVQTVQ